MVLHMHGDDVYGTSGWEVSTGYLRRSYVDLCGIYEIPEDVLRGHIKEVSTGYLGRENPTWIFLAGVYAIPLKNPTGILGDPTWISWVCTSYPNESYADSVVFT